MAQQTGSVAWFNSLKGFGFIKPVSEPDVFVHYSAILDFGYQGAIMAYLNGEPEWMRALEFVVGAAYIALFVYEWFQSKHSYPAHKAGPEWLELAAAGISWLEGFHIWHAHHVAQQISGKHSLHLLPWLYGLIGLFYALLALSSQKLERRQGLHFSDTGFSLRLLPMAPARGFEWKRVSRITPSGNGFDLHVYPTGGGLPMLIQLNAYSDAGQLSKAIRARAAKALGTSYEQLLASEPGRNDESS